MSELDRNVRNAIDDLSGRDLLKKKIVLFGAGNNSKVVLYELKYRGYDIYAIIDNNLERKGVDFMGYPVQYAPEFLKNNSNDIIYLVLSIYFSEIKKQLEAKMLVENIDFFSLVDIEPRKVEDYNFFQEEIDELDQGYIIYKRIVEYYGEEKEFWINPAASLGDVYLMSFYFNSLKSKNNVVLIFGSRVLSNMAYGLGMGNSIYIELDYVRKLVKFAQVFGFEKVNIKLLHTGFVHFRLWSRMLTLTNKTWMEHYQELFDLPRDTSLRITKLEYSQDSINQIFHKTGLEKGKTVILSPYANTMKEMPLLFWTMLTNKLKKRGYCVCTNIGNKSEIPIKGTIPVFIEIKDFCKFVEDAGVFIGIRSGLCDVLYECNAMRIILYSQEIFDLISVYDFYSLKKMGAKGKLEEIIMIDDWEELSDKIIESLG